MSAIRNILEGLFVLLVLVVTGTYLFSSIEGYSYFESLYYVVLTITTVGSQNPPVTVEGKIISMIILFFGMGTAIYIATLIAKTAIESQTRFFFTGIKGGFARMRKEKNHVIVCGYGRLGKYACEELMTKKKKYLIIEEDADKAKNLISKGLNVLQGDALDPEILKKANVMQAEALIGTLKEDADNLYLMMSAKDLNSKLLLAAKAQDESAVERLHKTGAQIVVLPQVVGGKQLVNAIMEVEKAEQLSTISKKNNKTIKK